MPILLFEGTEISDTYILHIYNRYILYTMPRFRHG